MAVRLTYGLNLGISSTENEERDLGDRNFQVASDDLEQGGSWKVTLPKSTTDKPIALANITEVRLLCLRTTAKDPTLPCPVVGMKVNSTGGSALPIRPIGDGDNAKEGILIMSTEGITSLYLTNADTATDVEVIVSVAGDGE